MSARARLEWVDAARGMAITLVVLFHSTNWLLAAGLPVETWVTVNATVATMRLPVFFIVSGLFAGKWVSASWRALWGTKLSLFVWVYILWSTIASVVFLAGLDLKGQGGGVLGQVRGFLEMLWAPRFELWFIWALALFFAAIRLLRRVPVAVQLIVAGIVSAVGLSGWLEVNVGGTGALKYFFFFLCGLHLRDAIFTWAERSRGVRGAAVVALAAAAAVPGVVLGWDTAVPGFYFLACCLGGLAGVVVARWLAPLSLLRRIGRHTLPVYLTHTSVIILLCWLISHVAAQIPPPVSVLAPPLLAATAIAASLALMRAVRDRPVVRLLYEQPEWFAGRSREKRPRTDRGSEVR